MTNTAIDRYARELLAGDDCRMTDDDCRMIARRAMMLDRDPRFNLNELTAAVIRRRDSLHAAL